MSDRGGTGVQPRPWLTDAAAGVIGYVVLTLAVGVAVSRYWITDPRLATLLAYLAVWLPLAAAVAVASYRHGTSSPGRDMGLRFSALDLLWGLGAGLLLRVAASLIEFAVYGAAAQPPATFVTARDAAWVFIAVLAPVIITPVVEEVFFRGLLLRAVLKRFGSASLAAVASGAVFAALHVVQTPFGPNAIAVGASTLILGLALSTLTLLTGRLGGAIVAHVTFNALGVVPALL